VMAITEDDEVSTVLTPPKATSCDIGHGNSSRRLLVWRAVMVFAC
jgi:hypothetical protein